MYLGGSRPVRRMRLTEGDEGFCTVTHCPVCICHDPGPRTEQCSSNAAGLLSDLQHCPEVPCHMPVRLRPCLTAAHQALK